MQYDRNIKDVLINIYMNKLFLLISKSQLNLILKTLMINQWII